jgi:hypothetical protein
MLFAMAEVASYRRRSVPRISLPSRKNIFWQILQNLQKEKKILKFETVDFWKLKDVPELILVKIFLDERTENYFRIVFCGVDSDKKVNKRELREWGIIVWFPEWQKYNQMKKIIEDLFADQLTNQERGRLHEDVVVSVIQKEIKKPHSRYSYCRKGTEFSNGRGRDVYVGYRDEKRHQKMVPTQIKSSKGYQKKHKLKYPKIPSLVVYDEMTEAKIVELITRICEAYLKGIILHL